MELKKAMLSQPMAGKTDEEIALTREKAIKALKEKGYTIVNTLFTDEWYSKESMTARGVVQIPLCFLAKSLENMSLCHAAYFCKGWEAARGCVIEHAAAKAYGLEIIYEEEPEHEKEENGVTFGAALEAVKKGARAKRKGWNGKEQYIELATKLKYRTVHGELEYADHDALAFVGTAGVQIGWLASQADMLSEDWTIFR